MKQLLYRLLFGCMTLLLLAACEADNVPFENNTDASNCIILNLEASSVPVRANVEGNDKENAVDHIDVFVFKTDTDNTLFHYERLQLTAANAGKAALTKKRSEFDIDAFYKVYIVANSTITDFATVKSLDDLKGKIQEDKAIHLTGLDNLQNVPQYFLMDGIAKASSTSADNTVILNDGMLANNTELEVDLKRAAAKIIVHMKKGSQVQFSTKPGQDGALYYMRNLPYSSTVLSGVGNDAKLRTSQPISTKYFDWKTEKITITAYAYAHHWKNGSLEKEPRLIVNIPLTYTPKDSQSKAEILTKSYYQIPVSSDQLLERNTCYETTVTINAPGGSDPSEPLKLEPINYTVNEWIGKPINIGGETVNLAYLTLNKYDMEMHNLTDDNTTLEFASSSNVKAKITKVWYIDKFGQEKTLSQVRTNPNQWSESNGNNLCEITITPDENITGNIHVHGTVPENNTVRYITFELTNEENITRTVTVAQYPLEYITNIQGWYSYRMDFEGTNYEKGENSHYTCATSYTKSTDKWSFSTYDYNSFFGSKVAYVQQNGTSSLNYYYYSYRSWSGLWNKIETSENLSSLKNARMYHVRITATSGEYTLGRPRMIDGKTDGGKDNEVLVSPSFMIASQLGAVNSNACKSVEMAASHCKQYVETYKDKEGKVHHVKGWRLPTKAEVAIIMKFQKKEDAIDIVLSGNQYWCASGCVKTSTGEIIPSTGSPVRCIRDAYDIEK